MQKSTIAILALMVTTSLTFADTTLTQTDSQMLFDGKVSKKVTILTEKEMKNTTGKALTMPEMPSIGGVGGDGTAIDMPSIDGVVDSGNSIEMPEMPTIGGVGGVSLFGN
jgi:hypothetical protein